MITAQVMALSGLLLFTMRALGAAALDTSVDPRGPAEYPGMRSAVDEHYRNFHTSYSIAWLQMLMDFRD